MNIINKHCGNINYVNGLNSFSISFQKEIETSKTLIVHYLKELHNYNWYPYHRI